MFKQKLIIFFKDKKKNTEFINEKEWKKNQKLTKKIGRRNNSSPNQNQKNKPWTIFNNKIFSKLTPMNNQKKNNRKLRCQNYCKKNINK